MENSIEEDINEIMLFLKFNKQQYLKYYDINDNQRYLFLKSIEHILSDYKRVLKENEEWQRAYQEEKDKQFELLRKNKNMAEEYLVNNPGMVEYLNDNYIFKQKVKDKIEEILSNGEYIMIFEGDAEFPNETTTINAQKYIKLEKLQELLEGRK